MAVEALFGTRAQRAFMGIILLQTIVVLTMIAITFSKVEGRVDLNNASFKTLPCYLALFTLAEIFELLMAWDALRLRNTIQLGGILIFHAGLIVSASLQAYETGNAFHDVTDGSLCSTISCEDLWHEVRPYLIVAPAAIAVTWIGMMFCVRALYFEFGWAIFHVVGANPQMKTMYQWYQLLICLLKFDFFCFTGVTMQMLIVVLQNDPAEYAEYAVTIAAIPIVLVLLVFCGIAVRREIKWLMAISCVLMLAAESYFYKLVRFYQPESEGQYKSTRTTLTFFTIVAFIINFATFANGLRCFADFDKGLLDSKTTRVHPRTSAYSNGKTSAEEPANLSAAERQSFFSGQPLQPRMSIE